MKVFYGFVILALFGYQSGNALTPCKLKPTSHGTVCVCNENYCDYIDEIDYLPIQNDAFSIISSSSKGLRFSKSEGIFNNSEKYIIRDYEETFSRAMHPLIILKVRGNEKTVYPFSYFQSYQSISSVFIDRKEKYQTVVGFGGAFTGSVAYVLDQIPKNLRSHVYKSYYGSEGIGYNLMRLSIGGCDFDLEPWAYNENPQHEIKLTNFTKLDQRDEDKIMKIKNIMKASNRKNIKFIAAAWSPPKWMKTNNKWTGLSFLKKEYYQTWADYHLRFLELMEAKNISIWAISTGNEPLNGVIGWAFIKFMSLGWTAGSQGIWVEQNLGPTIRNSTLRNVKILGNDDQRYTFPRWFQFMEKSAPDSMSYIDGFAVHWYWDQVFGPSLIDETLKLYGKNRILLNTESCIGDKPYETHGPELGSWERAEKYFKFYIENLQHGSNGWIDWNLILDETGGPNYVNNKVDAPVIVKTTDGMKEIYKQPMFYAIGHFSKFIPEGSIRIKSKPWNMNIDTIAFLRPDGYIACIISNIGKTSIDIKVTDSKQGSFVISIPEKSFHSVIYK